MYCICDCVAFCVNDRCRFGIGFVILILGVFWFWFALDVVADGADEGDAPNEHYTPASWFMYVVGCLVGYYTMFVSVSMSAD